MAKFTGAIQGLRQFCIGLPIAVLNDEPYDVCMEYEEDVVFTRPGRPPRIENGCSLFHDEVCFHPPNSG